MTTTYTLKRPPKNTPGRYGTESNKSAYETVVSAHYFLPGSGCDWYVLEYCQDDDEIFCWAEVIPGCGELGYSSVSEMEQLILQSQVIIGDQVLNMPCRVELDEYWTPLPLSDVLAERAKR